MGAMCSQSSANPVGLHAAPKADYIYTGQVPILPRQPKPEEEIKENPYTQFEKSFERFEKDWEKQYYYIRNQQEFAAEKQRKEEEIAAEKRRKIEEAKAAEEAKRVAEREAKLAEERAKAEAR